MNATQDMARKSVGRTTPLSSAATSPATQTEQREKNRRSFQAKCDAMLYVIEFIATFHLRNSRNAKQVEKMNELKSMVAQTRNGLGVSN